MAKISKNPDYIFEASWEVCNKVGGIYTVLSSRAKTLQAEYGDKLVFVGPDVWGGNECQYFTEDETLLSKWRKAATEAGLPVRIGRWNVPGAPVAVLVDFSVFFAVKDSIYAEAWDNFRVDSLHAYGDYDEASMYSYAAGHLVQILIESKLVKGNVVYQAHEWMSGLGMLFLKKACPKVKTIFTTHATSIGRSICGNNKQLYSFFECYNGDQMAAELNMEAKHSIEKQSAHRADCFTTVSTFTARECEQLLDKAPDVVLPNGFETDFVPKGAKFIAARQRARKRIIEVTSALCGEHVADDVLIISTSGRNDFRCKGFDVYIEAMAQLNSCLKDAQHKAEADKLQSACATQQSLFGDEQGVCGCKKSKTQVISLIEVPCWLLGPRNDLKWRLDQVAEDYDSILPNPQISHDLHNLHEDRILNLIQHMGLGNTADDPVKVVLVPCYLEGQDGIFNLPYYDMLCANDLAIYPSYYEPWGYTPLEAIAFKTPTVTTDLSGFGQWVNEVLGREGKLEDGVLVMHRDDSNYFEVASEVATAVEKLLQMPKTRKESIRKKAAALSAKAEWKHFISYYKQAYTFALAK